MSICKSFLGTIGSRRVQRTEADPVFGVAPFEVLDLILNFVRSASVSGSSGVPWPTPPSALDIETSLASGARCDDRLNSPWLPWSE